MASKLDDMSNSRGSTAHQQKTATSTMKPRTSALVLLVLALLLGALSVLVMLPAARHLRSLQDGERARATLHTSGACMIGACQVEFEADGRTVVADLPVGSSGGKNPVGTRLTIRYQTDDPQVVAGENDVDGGGAAVFAVMSGAGALIFLLTSAVAAFFAARERRAHPAPGRISQNGRRQGADQAVSLDSAEA
jgi:hypothetical protein